MTPIEKFRKHHADAGKTLDEIRLLEKEARRKFDGKPGNIPNSIPDWLAKLPPKAQDEAVGFNKARLFRLGKLTKTRELITQNDRPLRPNEL